MPLSMNLLGFPAVNGELTVTITDSLSGSERTARPFLDGTVAFPTLAAGGYQVAVRHPNLAIPVIQQFIRVLPVGETRISLLIDPSRFRNTAIADVPDANLGPVRDAATTVEQTVQPLAAKRPGEAITAQDWNLVAGNVAALATAVVQLTRLVTPTGHNHPELESKANEIQGNVTALLESVTTAMTELQRQIQAERVRKQVLQVADRAGLGTDNPALVAMLDAVGTLDHGIVDHPSRFAQLSRTAGVRTQTALQELLDGSANDPDLAQSAQVKALAQSIDLMRTTNTTSYGTELQHLRKSDLAFGGGGLTDVLKR